MLIDFLALNRPWILGVNNAGPVFFNVPINFASWHFVYDGYIKLLEFFFFCNVLNSL